MNTGCCLKPEEKSLCSCHFDKVLSDIGKKWAVVILNLLYAHGPLGYNAIFHKILDITPKAFGDKLQMLEDTGLIEKKVIVKHPFRTQYSLTSQGARILWSLAPFFNATKKKQ